MGHDYQEWAEPWHICLHFFGWQKVDLDCNQQSHPGKDVTVNRGEVSAGRSEVPWEDASPSLYLNLAVWLWQVEAAFLLSSPPSTHAASSLRSVRGVTHTPSFYLKEEILPNSPPTSFLLFIFYVYGCFTCLYACTTCVRLPGWDWSCKLL